MQHWQLQKAKARLSELVKLAETNGPQHITVRGKPAETAPTPNTTCGFNLDGSQHADAKEYDGLRTKYLEAKGFSVLRFWNNLVFKERQNVIEAILRSLEK